LVPVPKDTGINRGYLGYSHGIQQTATVTGVNRGAVWDSRRNRHLRVNGNNLYLIDSAGAATDLGAIPGAGRVAMEYSFNTTAICADGQGYLVDASNNINQITDPDLGFVFDVTWIDGYYIFTDGDNLVQTEITDETQVNPIRYGSSEISPDAVRGVGRSRNQLVAFNRFTTEFFRNVGGTGFVFARIPSAVVYKGTVGVHTKTEYLDTYAFLGGGEDENVSVWLLSSNPQKLATREIEEILSEFTEEQLANVTMDKYRENGHDFLLINLPDGRKLVYDAAASAQLGTPAWHIRTWDAESFIHAYGKWWTGGNGRIGTLEEIGTEWGAEVERQFETNLIYAENNSVIINRLELTMLPGRTNSAIPESIGISFSSDGLIYTPEKLYSLGARGQYGHRVIARRQGKVNHYRSYRFRTFDGNRAAFARLDVDVEVLGNG
jgi:hypothetical protein